MPIKYKPGTPYHAEFEVQQMFGGKEWAVLGYTNREQLAGYSSPSIMEITRSKATAELAMKEWKRIYSNKSYL